MSRRSLIAPFGVLFACLAVLTACSKKKSGGGGGDDTAPPGPTPQAPGAVSSDYLLFAHLNAKQILTSQIFTEVKQAVAKAGGGAEWDRIEQEAAQELGGVKPTEIDSVTVCVAELSAQFEPQAVVIVSASKPLDKAKMSFLGPQPKPDARGLYAGPSPMVQFHFPDPKTLVIVTPNVAPQYLDGYAKDRAGWPMTAELSKAAAGHTLFAVAHLDKLPQQLQAFVPPQAKSVLSARTVTVTADLKGKELSVGGRVAFPDAAAAASAKETAQQFIAMALGQVDKVMTEKEVNEVPEILPVIKEAQRALKDAKVAVVGSDLTVAGSYKADFDINAIVAGAVPKMKAAAERAKAQNYLKQIGIALHNYHDANGVLPIHATGANGQAMRNTTDKPLLSWRVAILPYIEQNNLYQQFKLNEPWDSPNNKKLIEQMPKIFAPGKPGKPGYTHLQMVVGPGAMQAGSSFVKITDGTSNTFAVVEAAEPVIWTKPDDVMLGKEPPKDLKKKFGGLFPGGFNVLMWDGSVRFVRDTVSDRTLSLLINPSDGQPIPNDW
jgi:prepilin-type processing-associated H-X9-DG protein